MRGRGRGGRGLLEAARGVVAAAGEHRLRDGGGVQADAAGAGAAAGANLRGEEGGRFDGDDMRDEWDKVVPMGSARARTARIAARCVRICCRGSPGASWDREAACGCRGCVREEKAWGSRHSLMYVDMPRRLCGNGSGFAEPQVQIWSGKVRGQK